MIDERFSLDAFERCGKDTSEAAELACSLKQEVLEEMHETVMAAFGGIVSRLNEMGHGLRPYIAPVAGELSYRDDSGEEESEDYVCGLRLAYDSVVSAGYAHIERGPTGDEQEGRDGE